VPFVEESVLFLGRALCTYVANGANEVSVEKNARLAVLSQQGSFYRVRTSVGEVGLFPSGLLTHVRRPPSNHDRTAGTAAAAAATAPQQLPAPPPVSAADAVAAAAVATAASSKSGAAGSAFHFEFKMRIVGRTETFTVRLPIDALVQQLHQEVQHALTRMHIDVRGMYILDKYNRRMDPKIAIGQYDLQRTDDLSVMLRVQSPTPIRTRASTGGIRAGNNASASPLPSAPQPQPQQQPSAAARARPMTMSAMPLPISRAASLPPIAKVERVAVAAAPVPLVVNGLTVSMFCDMFPDLPSSVVAEELAMIESGDEEEAVTALSALASVFGESLRSSSSDAFGSSDLRPANADESVLWFHDTERDGWQLFGPASVALLENGIVHGAPAVRLADESTVDLQSMLWSTGNRSFVVRRELHLRANRGRSPSAPVGSVSAASAAAAAVAAAVPAFVGAPPVAAGRRALSGDIVANKPNAVAESLDEELTWQSDDEPDVDAGAKSRGAAAAAAAAAAVAVGDEEEDDDDDLDDDRVTKLAARRSSTPLSTPSTPSTPLDLSRGSPAQNHVEELDDAGKVLKLFNESISPHFRISFNELTEKPFSTLGEGAYGCVYRGIWRGADVAVKEIRPQRNGGKLMLEFVREAALMARIRSHSNLVTFLGACDHPLYIVTELMPNGSLRALLDRRDEPMDAPLKLRILRDIARGMLHLSLEKVVHRDLAARNVLLGENYVAKVADFGLSRSLSDYAPVYTGHGGALAWLAPESLEPPCVFTTMSDVWMFGVTAIEVLTRQLPCPDQLPFQVAMRVINGELNHMDQLTTDVPAALREVLTRCFARSPEARPAFRELTTVINDELNPVAKSVVAPAATPVRLDDYDDDGSAGGAGGKPTPSKSLNPAVAPNAASRWSIDSVDEDDAINDPLPPLPPLPSTQE
jgi:serine/threonine protein kinase